MTHESTGGSRQGQCIFQEEVLYGCAKSQSKIALKCILIFTQIFLGILLIVTTFSVELIHFSSSLEHQFPDAVCQCRPNWPLEDRHDTCDASGFFSPADMWWMDFRLFQQSVCYCKWESKSQVFVVVGDNLTPTCIRGKTIVHIHQLFAYKMACFFLQFVHS